MRTPAAPVDPRRSPWRIALFGAAVASVICVQYPLMGLFRSVTRSHYPQLVRCWDNNGSFAVIGVTGMETADESTYAARVEESARRFWPGDPYLGGRPSPRLLSTDFISYVFMGLVRRLTGDINTTWILLRWACAFAWFLLVYATLWRATERADLALLGAGFTVFFSYMLHRQAFAYISWADVADLSAWPSIVWKLASVGRTESVLRLPRPGLGYAALFACGLLAAGASDRRRALAAGLAGGLLAYVRADCWSTHIAAMGLFAATMAWRRRSVPWPLLFSGALAAAVSLPWVFWNLPMPEWVLERIDWKSSRAVDLLSLPYAAAWAAALAWGRGNPMILWLGSVAGGVFLICNVQVLTGRMLWDMFHWRYIGDYYLFFVAAALAGQWAPARLTARFDRLRLGSVGLAALACAALAQGVVYAGLHFPFQALAADQESAFEWLRERSPEDAVVASLSPEVTKLVPVYAGRRTLISHASPHLSDVELEENAARLGYMLELLDSGPEALIGRLASAPPNDRRSMDRVGNDSLEWGAAYFLHYPGSKVPAHLRESDKRRRAEGGRFPVDYVWSGPFERQLAGKGFPDKGPLRLHQVYANQTVTLYQVVP